MSAIETGDKLISQYVGMQREIGRRGTLHDFVKMAWPQTNPGDQFKDNWHLGVVCEHLEAMSRGQIRNLVINVPPGSSKSRITGLFWPVWGWLRDPATVWGTFSFDIDLVYREAAHSLDLIRSEWFRSRWGDMVEIKEKSPAIGNYENTVRGRRYATTTPRGAVTGWHFDYRIIDDPHKPQGISKVTLEESEKWWRTTLPTRVKDASTARTAVIMQRLHERDMSGLAEDDGYVMLRIPMRYEASVYSLPSAPDPVAWKDPRELEGALMWEARFPDWWVRQEEIRLGPSGTAAQFQQRPVAEGGATFRADWFRTWVPRGSDTSHLAPGTWAELPSDFDEIIQSWDCTFKDTDGTDCVCGQVWARKGMDFFLRDEVCARMSFSATCDAIRAMSQRWPGARPIIVEDKANGAAVVSVLKEELHGIEEVDPQGGKLSRANATTGCYAAGNVYHPDPLAHPWVLLHRRELQSFPFGGNDDRVDAMSQALIFLMQKFRAFGAAMNVMAEVLNPKASSGPVGAVSVVKNAMDILFGPGRVL